VAGAAVVERVDKQEQACGDGDRAGDVKAFASATAASVDGQEDSRHRDENYADRNVDPEDPVPARALGEQTTCEYPDRPRHPGDGAV
jgi:hypothetical protein